MRISTWDRALQCQVSTKKTIICCHQLQFWVQHVLLMDVLDGNLVVADHGHCHEPLHPVFCASIHKNDKMPCILSSWVVPVHKKLQPDELGLVCALFRILQLARLGNERNRGVFTYRWRQANHRFSKLT